MEKLKKLLVVVFLLAAVWIGASLQHAYSLRERTECTASCSAEAACETQSGYTYHISCGVSGMLMATCSSLPGMVTCTYTTCSGSRDTQAVVCDYH